MDGGLGLGGEIGSQGGGVIGGGTHCLGIESKNV